MAVVSEVFATFLGGEITLYKAYDDRNSRVLSMRGVNNSVGWRATISGQLGAQRVEIALAPGEDKTQDVSGVFGNTSHDQISWGGSFERVA